MQPSGKELCKALELVLNRCGQKSCKTLELVGAFWQGTLQGFGASFEALRSEILQGLGASWSLLARNFARLWS